ncbi:MAG: phosphatidate cytidylyltransferase [Candidatus Sigynarchaeota archaeon]
MFQLSSIPVMILFITFGIFTLRHSLKIKRTKDPEILEFIDGSTFYNEFLLGALFISCGLLWPFIYTTTGASAQGAETLYIMSSAIILGFGAAWFVQCNYNLVRCKKDPEEKRKRLAEQASMIERRRNEIECSHDVEIKRKVLHVIPGAVIAFMQLLSAGLDRLHVFDGDTGIDRASFALFGEVTVAGFFLLMFQYAELLRLESFCQLPAWAKRWFFSSLKKNEMKSFSTACTLVVTLFPFIFGPVQVLVCVAFVSSFADAASGLFGRKYGKRRFPAGSPQTVAGYMAGTSCAFLIVLVFASLFNYEAVPFRTIILMAVVAALVIFLVDVFTRTLWDNLLNPLLVGAAMIVVLAIA